MICNDPQLIKAIFEEIRKGGTVSGTVCMVVRTTIETSLNQTLCNLVPSLNCMDEFQVLLSIFVVHMESP